MIGYLKLVGGLLLLWIGVKLVQGEEEDGDGVKAAGSLWTAVRTIIIADAVMSLDNAIAIAAAAKGDTTLIVLGLLISIPLIIFGATLIMMLLEPLPDHRHRRRRPAGLDRGRGPGDRSRPMPRWLAARIPNAQDVVRDRRRRAHRRAGLLRCNAAPGEEGTRSRSTSPPKARKE